MFYGVVYKSVGRSKSKSIVRASTQEEAISIFYNPNEIGKEYVEIYEAKPAKRITKGWNVSYESDPGFVVTGKALKEIDLTDENNNVELMVGNKKKVTISVKDIISSSRPSKDKNVMGKRVFY